MKKSSDQVKIDVYTIVTNKIIEQLEKGIAPWKRPWNDTGIPQNFITRKPYRGINVLLLSVLGYPKNYFLTWRQIKGVGGSVKHGEKPHLVVFWRWIPVTKDSKVEDSVDDTSITTKKKALLRYYYVYNVEQCECIPTPLFPVVDRSNNPIEVCEDIVYDMPKRPSILHDAQAAYYDPIGDYINMPRMNSFKDSESYYTTLFHELIHCTGHNSRLNRKELANWGPFGSESYSIEELVAEIGACYLSSYTGIGEPNLTNNVAYLQGWLLRLQNDKRFIINASSKAQQAVDYILKVKSVENEVDITEVLVQQE